MYINNSSEIFLLSFGVQESFFKSKRSARYFSDRHQINHSMLPPTQAIWCWHEFTLSSQRITWSIFISQARKGSLSEWRQPEQFSQQPLRTWVILYSSCKSYAQSNATFSSAVKCLKNTKQQIMQCIHVGLLLHDLLITTGQLIFPTVIFVSFP